MRHLQIAASTLALLLATVALTAPPVQAKDGSLDAAKLAQIPAQMTKFVEDKQVAGVVTLLAWQGKVVHLEAVGLMDVETKQAMKTDSLFAIASMTKPISATAIMILQDEGKLSVDDPVARYLPEFKAAALADGPPNRPITIRDLMTHTAGLGGSQRCETSLQATVEEIVKRPLSFHPGTKWQYSPGLNVCARIVEVLSDQPFDVFLAKRIFAPLKMVDTTFDPTPEQRQRLVSIHKPGDEPGTIVTTEHWLTGDAGQRAPNPSGGLVSSAADMARFYQMVLNGGQLDGRRIVSEKAVRQMTSVQTGDDITTGFTEGNGWGLGWCVVRQPQAVTRMLSPGTYGHGGAFGTQGWVDPVRQMILVLMIQRNGFGNGDASAIRDRFQQTAVEALRP